MFRLERYSQIFYIAQSNLQSQYKISQLSYCIFTKTVRKKKKVRGIRLPDFKLFSKAIIIKAVWYQPKNRYTETTEQNSLETVPHIPLTST